MKKFILVLFMVGIFLVSGVFTALAADRDKCNLYGSGCLSTQ